MDILVKYLSKYNFIRICASIRPPVVVHCVPGAGKSSLIREIILEDSRFVAFTCGIPDQPNLEGRWIQRLPEKLPEGKFVLIDEYTLSNSEFNAFALFGDPLQSNHEVHFQANFICRFSHRFGLNTAALLNTLGFDIEASGEDQVQIEDIFSKDPEGQVVYFEEEVGKLLCAHGVKAKKTCEIVGQTFECVTFVTAENKPLSNPTEVFQCITRHRKKLIILCPNATYTSSR